MKNKFIFLLFILIQPYFHFDTFGQNVGVGVLSPEGKLHVKGSEDVSQFIIEANSTQSNLQPLFKLLKSDGSDLMWIHSDHPYNTFVGYNAGRSNTAGGPYGDEGILNTFIGSEAGRSNTIGTQNTATGSAALYSNTVGYGNTASGGGALSSNTLGFYNTACGAAALYNNSGGSHNTATGKSALYQSSNGFYNTADGFEALYSNISGSYNTASGMNALLNNSSGYFNTAYGYNALHTNTTGHENTAIGFDARNDLTTSEYNTIIGSGAHVGLGADNSVVLGVGTFTNTSNLALLGNPATMYCGGYVNWTNFSDGRFKTGVQENVKGLDFITRLRPVTYHMNIRGLYDFWGISEEISGENRSRSITEDAVLQKEAIAMNGFIAQEVEIAAHDAGYAFDGVHKPAHDKDHYRISYATFVVPLVKAVQELSQKNQELSGKNNEQDMIIDKLLLRIEKLESLVGVKE